MLNILIEHISMITLLAKADGHWFCWYLFKVSDNTRVIWMYELNFRVTNLMVSHFIPNYKCQHPGGTKWNVRGSPKPLGYTIRCEHVQRFTTFHQVKVEIFHQIIENLRYFSVEQRRGSTDRQILPSMEPSS